MLIWYDNGMVYHSNDLVIGFEIGFDGNWI